MPLFPPALPMRGMMKVPFLPLPPWLELQANADNLKMVMGSLLLGL